MNFNDFGIVPEKDRIHRCLKGEQTDRIPYFKNYIGEKIVEFILGYHAGNTAASVGDPYRCDERAIVDGGRCIPMHPKDWIKICKVIGQDVIMMEACFAPPLGPVSNLLLHSQDRKYPKLFSCLDRYNKKIMHLPYNN